MARQAARAVPLTADTDRVFLTRCHPNSAAPKAVVYWGSAGT